MTDFVRLCKVLDDGRRIMVRRAATPPAAQFGTDRVLIALAHGYDQGTGGKFEFDQPTLLRLLRHVQTLGVERAAVKTQS